MAEQEKNESFFRKVVRFVANPATDWADLTSRQEDTKELELEKSELKAMIERKRRNDFVRKREFDMLRKVRREGLSPEQLAALGGSSRLDDSESRSTETPAARPDGVKAKIDEIEQQMVGEGGFSSGSRRPPPNPWWDWRRIGRPCGRSWCCLSSRPWAAIRCRGCATTRRIRASA